MGLIEEREQLAKELFQSIEELHSKGIELANAEANYKMLYGKYLAIEKAKPKEERALSSVIDSYIKSLPEVALARLKRDQLEALVKVETERINALKLVARFKNDDIQREWSIEEGTN